MAAIEKMSLVGKYGEVVQTHPLQHPADIVVQILLKTREDQPLLMLQLHYAFVNFGSYKTNTDQLFKDIAEHVDQCMGVDGFESPKSERKDWMEIGFTQRFVDASPLGWDAPPKVLS